MPYSIDLKAHFIPDDHHVYALHPGQSKRFYREFIEQERVFLDLPGIRIEPGFNASSRVCRAELRMARQIAAWYRGGSHPDREPSREISDHVVRRRSEQSPPRYVGEANELYNVAKKGDLVVVPGADYNSLVYIGELIEPYDARISGRHAKYGRERIPARRVRWLDASKVKAVYSEPLIKAMQHPQALTRLGVDHRTEIYRFAYGQFVLPESGMGRISLTKGLRDTRSLKAIELIDYIASMYNAVDLGQLESFLCRDRFDAIKEYYPADAFQGLTIESHSPGFVQIKSTARELNIFVAVMLFALSSGAVAKDGDIEIKNSSPHTDNECEVVVQEKVREIMRMTNFAKWREWCKWRRHANDQVGLESSIEADDSLEVQVDNGNAPASQD